MRRQLGDCKLSLFCSHFLLLLLPASAFVARHHALEGSSIYPSRHTREGGPFRVSPALLRIRSCASNGISLSSTAEPLDEENNENDILGFATEELGGFDPYEKFGGKQIEVGDPQIKVKEKERSVTAILKELAAIQQQGPRKYCILGTRHCSYLHQQIIELLYVKWKRAVRMLGSTLFTLSCTKRNMSTVFIVIHFLTFCISFIPFPQSIRVSSFWESRLYIGSWWHTRGHDPRGVACRTAGSSDRRPSTVHGETDERVSSTLEKGGQSHRNATE